MTATTRFHHSMLFCLTHGKNYTAPAPFMITCCTLTLFHAIDHKCTPFYILAPTLHKFPLTTQRKRGKEATSQIAGFDLGWLVLADPINTNTLITNLTLQLFYHH